MFELKIVEGFKYHFTLKATNGQVLLTSEVYSSKPAAISGIKSVQKNAIQDGMYERKTAKDGRFFFNLKATNGEIIGSSQMYSSESGMENGIKSVLESAPKAQVKEI